MRADKPPPTIYDIAKLAGVNPSTVSRALNKPGRISPKTEKRVHDAARSLNFRANPMARALPTGRTNTIGLIVADITNPVFFNVVRGAENAAAAQDYTMVLAESVESADNERRVAERLARAVDGLVLTTPRITDMQIQEFAAGKPVVVINRFVEGVPGIIPDVDHGIAEAIRHLSSLGHRSLTYLAGPSKSWMSQRRWQSIRERCAWSNMSVSEIGPEAPTVEGGRAAAAAVRDGAATAVVAFNDLMAIGLMQELAAADVRVPHDLSIIGFDNIFGSDFTTPPLTTVMSPLAQAGALAFATIQAQLNGVEPPQTDGKGLRTTLIVRGSIGPALATG